MTETAYPRHHRQRLRDRIADWWKRRAEQRRKFRLIVFGLHWFYYAALIWIVFGLLYLAIGAWQ